MTTEEKLNEEVDTVEAGTREEEVKRAKPAKQNSFVLNGDEDGEGAVRISQNVIARIVSRSVLGVEGVARFAPKGVADLVNIFSDRSYDSSILIEFKDGKVCIALALLVYFGAVIPEVTRKVQQVVREQLETCAGAKVGRIDVLVKDLVDPESNAEGEETAAADGEAVEAAETDSAL